MRYAAVALAFAGAAMAHAEEAASTVYSTKFFTITSCAPEVTNCPARSTVVSSSVVPVITTSAASAKITASVPAVVPAPVGGNGTFPKTETGVKPVPVAPTVSQPATLATSAASVCGGSSVKTISTSITTVIPTVIYETVQVPCPTPTKPTAVIPPVGGNQTTPMPPPTSPITAGAAGLSGSAALAAVAGVAALVFA